MEVRNEEEESDKKKEKEKEYKNLFEDLQQKRERLANIEELLWSVCRPQRIYSS